MIEIEMILDVETDNKAEEVMIIEEEIEGLTTIELIEEIETTEDHMDKILDEEEIDHTDPIEEETETETTVIDPIEVDLVEIDAVMEKEDTDTTIETTEAIEEEIEIEVDSVEIEEIEAVMELTDETRLLDLQFPSLTKLPSLLTLATLHSQLLRMMCFNSSQLVTLKSRAFD